MKTPMQEILELRKMQTDIRNKEYKFQELLMKQLKSYKGKYIKDKIDSSVIEFSVTFVPMENNDWSNCLSTIHSFFCYDGKSCWYVLNEKRDISQLHELEKLEEGELISNKDYKRIIISILLL